MTKQELLEALKKYPDDMPIYYHDSNLWGGVEVQSIEPYVHVIVGLALLLSGKQHTTMNVV